MDAGIDWRTDGWIEILDEWAGSVWIPQDTYINVFSLVIIFSRLNSLTQVRGDKPGLILMQIIFMGSFSLSFLRFAVCQTLGTLQTQTRCCVKWGLVGLYKVQRCPCFVKLIK